MTDQVENPYFSNNKSSNATTVELNTHVDTSNVDAKSNEANYEFIIVVLLVAVFLCAIIKPLRETILWFTTNIIIPSTGWLLKVGSLWFVWLFKHIVMGHIDLIRHLVTPRKIIFPSLEDQLDERDKKINRKIKRKVKLFSKD